MSDATELPLDLPAPTDDGACDHLLGLELPDLELEGVDGRVYSLRAHESRWLVIYAYPRTGGGDVVLPADWDLIPGARGCTPQACASPGPREPIGGSRSHCVGGQRPTP